jgi:hypothetical protein
MTLSDGHDKRDIVTIEKKIHSIKISKKLLEGLVKIIEEGYADAKSQNERYCRTSYAIK